MIGQFFLEKKTSKEATLLLGQPIESRALMITTSKYEAHNGKGLHCSVKYLGMLSVA